jgi:hypothetical protein
MADVTITEGARGGEWLVSAERMYGDTRGGGQVTVRSNRRPNERSAYAGLAAARAWLEVAARRLRARDAEAALAAARSGLEELGAGYAGEGVRDDTKLKLAAADDQASEGDTGAAAEIVLDVLRTRAGLLEERESGAIVA